MEAACRNDTLRTCSTTRLRGPRGRMPAAPVSASAGELSHSTTEGEQSGTAPAIPPGGTVDITTRVTQDLYLACLAEQGAASSWCSAYLMGVADTLTAFGNGGDRAVSATWTTASSSCRRPS